MCVLMIMMAGMRPLLVRPPLARMTAHVEPVCVMVIRWGHPHPPTSRKSTMGLSIRPRQSAGSRQGSSPDIITAFPGMIIKTTGSRLGLINRLTVQWVIQNRCKRRQGTIVLQVTRVVPGGDRTTRLANIG